jgi:mannose-6-phosphate isomerase-like protein (cupin superfamily)
MERGQTAISIGWEARDPLHAEEIAGAARTATAEEGRHRVGERSVGSRMDGDLRRKLGVLDKGNEGPFGQLELLAQRRHGVEHVGGREVAEWGHGRSLARYDRAMTSDRSYADRLLAEGPDPSRWANGPGDRYDAHEHGYDKVIVVESGSITFGLPAMGESQELASGDRLELPAGVRHEARVGRDGVSCLEVHVARGTLSQVRRVAAGDW